MEFRLSVIKTSKEKIDKRDFRFKKISLNVTIRLRLIENLFCVGLNVSNFSDPSEKNIFRLSLGIFVPFEYI